MPAATFDEIYAGYRQLTGATPLLPKAAYGYIQCKQRYASQEELLAVAKGYRDRHLPADILVVDWFYYTKMGEMDFAVDKWPDPAAMNRQLHDMGFQTMISVWPRFTKGSRYYDFLLKKGWFEHLADGKPTDGLPYDRAGSDIDTTNPDAAAGSGKPSATTFSAKVSIPSGPMKPSPTCRPTAVTSRLGLARATSTSIRCFTPAPYTTDSAAIPIIAR